MTKHLFLAMLVGVGCAAPQVERTAFTETRRVSTNTEAARPTVASAKELAFGDLLDQATAVPSETLRSADGKQVRLIGFMAQMEEGPSDGFYLTRRPVFCDEMGAGTGDLPVDSVRVHVVPPSSVPFLAGRVVVEGRLELGGKEDVDGRVTHIRVFVDRPSVSRSH